MNRMNYESCHAARLQLNRAMPHFVESAPKAAGGQRAEKFCKLINGPVTR